MGDVERCHKVTARTRRLRLLGSGVESIMMTNFNLQLSDAPGV